jgi:hypothetical protein
MIKVKRNDVVAIWNFLYKLKEASDKALTFYVVRNLAFLEDEVKSITSLQESTKPSEEYIEFDTKRMELNKKHAKTDANGEPIIRNNVFIFKDPEAWREDFNKLTTEYVEVITEQDKTINEYQQLMAEEIELPFKKIPYTLLPDTVNYDEVKLIIKETEEEVERIILGSVPSTPPIKTNLDEMADMELPMFPVPPTK